MLDLNEFSDSLRHTLIIENKKVFCVLTAHNIELFDNYQEYNNRIKPRKTYKIRDYCFDTECDSLLMYSRKSEKLIHKIIYPSKTILLNWFDHLKREGGVYCPQMILKSDHTSLSQLKSKEDIVNKNHYNHINQPKINNFTKQIIEIGPNFSFKNKDINFKSTDDDLQINNYAQIQTTASNTKEEKSVKNDTIYLKKVFQKSEEYDIEDDKKITPPNLSDFKNLRSFDTTQYDESLKIPSLNVLKKSLNSKSIFDKLNIKFKESSIGQSNSYLIEERNKSSNSIHINCPKKYIPKEINTKPNPIKSEDKSKIENVKLTEKRGINISINLNLQSHHLDAALLNDKQKTNKEKLNENSCPKMNYVLDKFNLSISPKKKNSNSKNYVKKTNNIISFIPTSQSQNHTNDYKNCHNNEYLNQNIKSHEVKVFLRKTSCLNNNKIISLRDDKEDTFRKIIISQNKSVEVTNF